MTPFKTPSQIGRFLHDESGAVTVDWVVLTAGVMMLFIALSMPIIQTAITTGSEGIADTVESANAFLTP